MKNILSPSILSVDFKNMGKHIGEADRAGARYLHIDVMDGMFVPSISLGMPVIKSIRSATDMVFDVHLMIMDPIRYIREIAEVGADIITFHLEAASDAKAVIDLVHSLGKKAGITIKPATPVEELVPYLESVDMILLMTVEPGFGGQSFIESSYDKIRTLRKMLDDRGLSTDIEVDGGIKTGNVRSVLEAGANVIVAGSAIFEGDVEQNTRDFMSILGEE